MSTVQLKELGYTVIRQRMTHTPVMDTACEELLRWLRTGPDVERFRYVHAPEWVASGGADPFVAVLQEVAEEYLGKGNATRNMKHLPQLLGWFARKHVEGPHCDNIGNALDEAKRLAETNDRPVATEPVLYPLFQVITAVAITSFSVRVWPGKHLQVAEFYRQGGDDIRDLLTRVEPEVIDVLTGPQEVLTLNCGDVLVMNHLLPHAAMDTLPPHGSPWIWEGHGPIPARCYQRFRTIDPPPEGLAAMRDPWHGCRGMSS